MNSNEKMITAAIAYREYGIPRSMLRSLVEHGVVRMVERTTASPYVLKLYSDNDIRNYLDNSNNY